MMILILGLGWLLLNGLAYKRPVLDRFFIFCLPYLGSILLYMRDHVDYQPHKHKAAEEFPMLQIQEEPPRKKLFLEETLLLGSRQNIREVLLALVSKPNQELRQKLQLAREEEDREVVHYATTLIAERLRKADQDLLTINRLAQEGLEKPGQLKEYTHSLGKLLASGELASAMQETSQKEYLQACSFMYQQSGSMEEALRLVEALRMNGELEKGKIFVLSLLEQDMGNADLLWSALVLAIESRDRDLASVLLEEMNSQAIYYPVEKRQILDQWQKNLGIRNEDELF